MISQKEKAEIVRALMYAQYPRNRTFSPQTKNPRQTDLNFLRQMVVHLRTCVKKAPKRGYSTRGLSLLINAINTEISDVQYELCQQRSNITQRKITVSPAKSDFTFINCEPTDAELDAYDKWQAKAQQDFHTILTAVLSDDLKLSVSLSDETYFATLVGQKDGKYANQGLTARSEDLFDAILLVCYKHTEILSYKWTSRKGKRGGRG